MEGRTIRWRAGQGFQITRVINRMDTPVCSSPRAAPACLCLRRRGRRRGLHGHVLERREEKRRAAEEQGARAGLAFSTNTGNRMDVIGVSEGWVPTQPADEGAPFNHEPIPSTEVGMIGTDPVDKTELHREYVRKQEAEQHDDGDHVARARSSRQYKQGNFPGGSDSDDGGSQGVRSPRNVALPTSPGKSSFNADKAMPSLVRTLPLTPRDESIPPVGECDCPARQKGGKEKAGL